MSKSKRIIILAAVLSIIAGTASYFMYLRTRPPKFDPAEWWEHHYPAQESPKYVLAKGDTVSSTGEERPLYNLKIAFRRYDEKYMAVSFSAIQDRGFFFPSDFRDIFLEQVTQFHKLKARLDKEYRPAYSERLTSFPVYDARHQQREIGLFFVHTPRFFRTRDGRQETKDFKSFIQIVFPFPLEEMEGFSKTVIWLDESAVEHLETILRALDVHKTPKEKAVSA